MSEKNKWFMTEEDIQWLLSKLQNYRKVSAVYDLNTVLLSTKECDMLIGLLQQEIKENRG